MATTVVLQSYRTTQVPDWVARCLASVEAWATDAGYDYRFLGDELFDAIPERYRMRAGHSMQLMTDLGRLLLARETLTAGADRAIWLDADIAVIAPQRFAVPEGDRLARELWVEPGADGAIVVSPRINNCACAFTRDSTLLPFYIDACQQLVRDAVGTIAPTTVGTAFLTALDRALPLPTIDGVGLWSPFVLRDVAAGGGRYLDALRANDPPYAAVNLCASFRGKTIPDPGHASIFVDDELFEAAYRAALDVA